MSQKFPIPSTSADTEHISSVIIGSKTGINKLFRPAPPDILTHASQHRVPAGPPLHLFDCNEGGFQVIQHHHSPPLSWIHLFFLLGRNGQAAQSISNPAVLACKLSHNHRRLRLPRSPWSSSRCRTSSSVLRCSAFVGPLRKIKIKIIQENNRREYHGGSPPLFAGRQLDWRKPQKADGYMYTTLVECSHFLEPSSNSTWR